MDTLDPGIGHNRPPDPIEDLRAQLAETHEPLTHRKDDLLAMGERAPASVDDDDTANKVADAIKACAAFGKNANAARVAAKEPHLAAGRAVDGWFAALADPVEKLKARLSALLTDYQKRVAAAERARREAEAAELRRQQQEAERQAREARAAARKAEAGKAAAEQQARDAKAAADKAKAEAEKAHAAATEKPAEMSRSRSDLGTTASLRRVWRHKVDNVELVPRSFLTVDHAAIAAFIKASTDKVTHECRATIPGVTIYPDDQSVVR